MAKNTWFKHYNTASLGASFERLRAARDFEAMACYWMLLELVSRHETEERRGEVELPKVLVHKYWNVSTHRAHRIMQQLMVNFAETMRIETSEQSYKLFLSNWSELQEKRGGKRKAKSEQNADRSKKIEVRGQIVEEETLRFEELFKSLPLVTQDTWISKYGKDFVLDEGALAYAYFATDTRSASWPPLTWASKIGSSLARRKEFLEKQQAASGTYSPYNGLAED